MVQKMFSIFDKKGRVFSPPRAAVNYLVLRREIKHELAKHASMVAANAADYDIYDVGSWDDATGVFEMINPPLVKHSLAEILKEDE